MGVSTAKLLRWHRRVRTNDYVYIINAGLAKRPRDSSPVPAGGAGAVAASDSDATEVAACDSDAADAHSDADSSDEGSDTDDPMSQSTPKPGANSPAASSKGTMRSFYFDHNHSLHHLTVGMLSLLQLAAGSSPTRALHGRKALSQSGRPSFDLRKSCHLQASSFRGRM